MDVNAWNCSAYVYLHAGILIPGFMQDAYQVSESSGSVEVCVNLTANLGRNLVISLQTMNGTAQGQFVVHAKLVLTE